MPYDYTKHLKPATIEGRAVEGGGGRQGGLQKTLQPQGFLALNRGIAYVIESLSFFDDSDRNQILNMLDYVYVLDRDEFPMLTALNRRALVRALDLDPEGLDTLSREACSND